MDRRKFLKYSSLGGTLLSTGSFSWKHMYDHDLTRLTILHTNDVHSHIDPFPMDGSRNEGAGGVSKRSALINTIRNREQHVLLLDAGDIFQGTPYFNFYEGEIEMKVMSEMGYDAATIGNHDFDSGIDNLKKQLDHASFPLIIGNYDFKNTSMNGHTSPYIIKNYGDIKVGITGVGIELNGLVPKPLYKETVYSDPIAASSKWASHLKNEEKCDYVICISHLGYKYRGNRVSDVVMAKESTDIDLIIGGHTHTFMYEPHIEKNKQGKEVIVTQAGWAGIMLGRLDILFERGDKNKCISCKNTLIK